jgi:hypothetical protein
MWTLILQRLYIKVNFEPFSEIDDYLDAKITRTTSAQCVGPLFILHPITAYAYY